MDINSRLRINIYVSYKFVGRNFSVYSLDSTFQYKYCFKELFHSNLYTRTGISHIFRILSCFSSLLSKLASFI